MFFTFLYTVIIATGAISISEVIKINNTLQFLSISSNPIGDEGIAAIARTLDKANISELRVRNCNITVTGAKSLAAALNINHTLKSLMILNIFSTYTNDITVDGVIAILEAAVANGVCQQVQIDNKYNNDDKVKKLMSTLEERKRQEVESSYYLILLLVTIKIGDKKMNVMLLCQQKNTI